MQVFDASSMIYAWDNYPLGQFPKLWRWLSAEIAAGTLMIPAIAFDEVQHKSPDCAIWLNDQSITKLPMTNAIAQGALLIKNNLRIDGDKYHPNGVGENDLFIIVTARENGAELVSDERRQVTPPIIQAKRKIPSVCGMLDVNVTCIAFIDYIKRSEQVFG
jgi:predicted nucleic acid-binding protein